jgi:excisionase family DNA binding protein
MRQDSILEKLSQIQNQLSENTDKPLPLQEASKYLNISKSYLYKLTCKQQIPHYKPNGKKIYFKRTELEEWLLKRRVKPVDEIEQEAIDYVTKKKGV